MAQRRPKGNSRDVPGINISGDIDAVNDVTAAGAVTGATGVTATAGGVTATAGDITATADDIVATAGDLIATAGNLIATAGDVVVTAGDVTVTAGDVDVTVGNITLAAVSISGGTGSPEAAVTAAVGSLFLRSDGGADSVLYMKESGAGNTGWSAMAGV